MKYLFFFKRFEIWLLLGVVVALLVFAFQPVEEPVAAAPAASDENIPAVGSGEGQQPPAETVPKQMTVREVTVEPTGGGQIVEVTLLARAKSKEPVPLNEKTLRASTDEGVEVPHFFAPFQPEQTVHPGEESLVTVRLWLAGATDTIWLDFQGERAGAELPQEL